MKADTVIEIIGAALRAFKDARVNDVTINPVLPSGSEIVLTTDDGEELQTWVLSTDDLHEADSDMLNEQTKAYAPEELCNVCTVPEHDTCANNPVCPCCRDSMREP